MLILTIPNNGAIEFKDQNGQRIVIARTDTTWKIRIFAPPTIEISRINLTRKISEEIGDRKRDGTRSRKRTTPIIHKKTN